MEKIEGIEFHFTATDEKTTLQAIKNAHVNKGSEHIGYHYVIKPNGEITNTRDESCVAAADKWSRNNYRFIQIAFVGDDKPTREQSEAMAKLAKDVLLRYSLPIDSVSSHSEW
jgi:N-acetyl-anhydromuramyl-L-alanine amidase AmpD